MWSALISFLGGNAFRTIFGEVSAYFTKKQDHKHEMDRMQLQGQLDAAAHDRNLAQIKLQADMGIKTIQVQADADLSRIDAGAWAQAVADVGRSTGIQFLDWWNGSIRPLLATVAISTIIMEMSGNHWAPTEHVLIIADAILGVYVADRNLAKRGK